MTEPERPSWEDYRRRRRWFWVALIGFLPVVVVVGMPLNLIVGSGHPAAVLAVAWMAFFVFAGSRMNGFPCPRCRKPFFYRPFIQNPLARRCMRCDWPKWVERSAPAHGGTP